MLKEIFFYTVEPKKHSIRFDTKEKDSPISTIYVAKEFFPEGTPKALRVELEAIYE